MPTISQEDWMRMVEGLGPDKAEAWRQAQGIEVGMPSAIPDAGAEAPSGALAVPEDEDEEAAGGALGGDGVDRMTILKDLQALQREDIDASRSDRDYRRRMFEQGRAELERRRLGPSTSEQLFALAAAFSQPQQYKGFGGMMANVMPVLARMSGQTREADQERTMALRKLEQDYMGDEQSLSRGERGSRRQYLTAMLAATKPEKPQLVWSERFGRFIPKDELTVIQGGSLNGKRTEKLSDGTVRIYEADGTFNLYDAGGRLVGSGGSPTGASGGPTQPASGSFRR